MVQKQAYQLADGTVTDQLTEEQAAKIAKWRQWSYYKLMYKEIDWKTAPGGQCPPGAVLFLTGLTALDTMEKSPIF